MTESILAGLWAGYGLAVPVGAIAALMVDMTARTSFRNGAAAAMGAASADALYAVAAVLGGAALAAALQPYAEPLRVAAAVILVAMAARIAVKALQSRRNGTAAAESDKRIRPARAYVTYLSLTALNPWPAIYFVALVLGRQTRGASAAEEAAYLVAIVAASASWQLLLAGGGAVLGRTLTSRRSQLVTAMVSSVLIAVLALKMVTGH